MMGMVIGYLISQQTVNNFISDYFIFSNDDRNLRFFQVSINGNDETFYNCQIRYHHVFDNLVTLSIKKDIQIDTNKIRKILFHDADSIEKLIRKYEWEMVIATGGFNTRGFFTKPNNYVDLKSNHYIDIIILINKYVERNIFYLNSLNIKYKKTEIKDRYLKNNEYLLLYQLFSVDFLNVEKYENEMSNLLQGNTLIQASFLMQQQRLRLLHIQSKFIDVLNTKVMKKF